jgi:hypothetical protein
MKYIVVIGDPFNGLTCYGPFESDCDDALKFAERECGDREEGFQIIQLHQPEASTSRD